MKPAEWRWSISALDSEAFLEVNNGSPLDDGAEADRQTDRQEGLEDKSAGSSSSLYVKAGGCHICDPLPSEGLQP